jgi:hypothetical protein
VDDRDNNQIAIWGNDKKETDRHPDFRGQGMVDGREYWVSAWKRDPGGNPRAPALKLKLTAKDEAAEPARRAASGPSSTQASAKVEEDLNDDIPF